MPKAPPSETAAGRLKTIAALSVIAATVSYRVVHMANQDDEHRLKLENGHEAMETKLAGHSWDIARGEQTR